MIIKLNKNKSKNYYYYILIKVYNFVILSHTNISNLYYFN